MCRASRGANGRGALQNACIFVEWFAKVPGSLFASCKSRVYWNKDGVARIILLSFRTGRSLQTTIENRSYFPIVCYARRDSEYYSQTTPITTGTNAIFIYSTISFQVSMYANLETTRCYFLATLVSNGTSRPMTALRLRTGKNRSVSQ